MIQKLQFMGKWWVRLLLLLTATAAVLSVAYRELRYRNRFGHFASYGIHADFQHLNNQLGIPGVRSSYCLVLSNFSISPITFDAVILPGGVVGTGLESRFRIEKWQERTREWLILVDSAAPDRSGLDHPNSVVRLWPGQSFYPAGCYALAAIDGFRKGDSIRLVVFTSFSKPEGAPGQKLFYSPTLVLDEERVTIASPDR